jgi:KDO2-lipid IV(A) lauroyltransferase
MLKDKLKYFGFCVIIFLCHILPGRFLYWIALRVSDLNYLFDKNGREAVKSNMRVILPDATEERITYETRWVFRNFGKYLTEFFRFRQFDKTYFLKHVALRGMHYVDEVLEKGNGCITLTAHLSNWELGAAGVSMLGNHPVSIVAAMHRYGKVNDLFMRERERMGLKVLDMRTAPRQVMKALRNNEIVGIPGDRDPTEQGIVIEFFGRPCRFPQGPARFAINCGSAIVPVFCLRRTNDSFTVSFEPPIYPPEEGTKEEKAVAMTQAYARVIEDAIRWHPEEWSVFYRVWEEGWKPS